MSDEEFRNGFLRIAGRSRTSGERRSERFNRRYTGAKGVGRLAAHKLATLLEIRSWKWNRKILKSGLPAADENGILATIDWKLVEQFETLDQIGGTPALRVAAVKGSGEAGTEINLRHPRRKWTRVQLSQFHKEASTLVPLNLLTEPALIAFGGTLLFSTPKIRDAKQGSFSVTLLGDLRPSEEMLQSLSESAALLIEVDCNAARGTVRYGVAPSERFASEFPGATRETYEMPYQSALPDKEADVILTFQARIFERAPQLDRKSTRLNSSHQIISYAVFCLKKKNKRNTKSTIKTNK